MVDESSSDMADEYFMVSPTKHSHAELHAGLWTTRICGIITLVSSLCMIWRAWNRREGLFHRLVLGMGIHLTIFGIANTIGASAIPGATTNAMANVGTTATCTAQGFLIYVTFLTASSYYGSFSMYSYFGTLNNFNSVNVMEIYIHVVVHIYPFCSGIYLITREVFNNSGLGYCFLEVDPIGCGDETAQDYVPCERGPDTQREAQLLQLFWTIFLYIEMLVPTAIMTTLYFRVKANQSNVQIPAKEVAKQAVVYLLVLYAGIFPAAIVDSLEWSRTLSVGANLFSDIMFMLFGLLSMLAYLYFTTGDWLSPEVSDEEDDAEEEDSMQEASADFIFGHLEKALKREGNGMGAIVPQSPASPKPPCGNGIAKRKSKRLSKRRSTSSRYSFNIFDGTNAAGQFADFVFEGDSSDLQTDMAETEKWNAVQNHI